MNIEFYDSEGSKQRGLVQGYGGTSLIVKHDVSLPDGRTTKQQRLVGVADAVDEDAFWKVWHKICGPGLFDMDGNPINGV